MSFDELFQDGVKAFQAKDYANASTFFTQALDLQPANTTVLVNLALAEYQAGQKSASYAHYKKALHIDPYFTTAQQGLDFVKSQIQIHEIPHRIETYERMRESFIEPFSVALPLILSTVVFVAWGFRLVKYLSQKKRAFFAGEDAAPYGVLNILLSLFLVVSLSWVVFFKFDSEIERGIVKNETVSLRTSPLATSPEILQLYGGLEVRILRKQDGWLQVEFPGATAGWVEPGSIVEL
jgi:tetratricopeptide (TPR) repeat protein